MTGHPRAQRDIYGRRPTSTSRGRTHDRVMALQHQPGTIPGAEAALSERPAGSIAEAIASFHVAWVETQPVTARRAYERSLALFARDLDANGPPPAAALEQLDAERLARHLEWRVEAGLSEPGELQRAGLHLARFAEWLDSERDCSLGALRDWLRERSSESAGGTAPPFHVAKTASELRDTSGDARALGAEPLSDL